jgi:hypothetical protein
MRTRAYRPEVPGCLEGRSLLSGVAGPSVHPVVLLHRQLNLVVDRMQGGFVLFARYHSVSQLRNEIDDVVVMIPFERLDGLDVSIDRIVDRMAQDISAHVPGAIRSASHDVTAATIADVKARVRAGDVVVR